MKIEPATDWRAALDDAEFVIQSRKGKEMSGNRVRSAIATIAATAFVAFALFMTSLSPTMSAELPFEFIGTWALARAGDDQCKMDDRQNTRKDGIISIGATFIEFSDRRCEVLDVKRGPTSSLVDLACASNGSKWGGKQVLHPGQRGSRKELIVVSLNGLELRLQRKDHTNVYLECR